MLDMFKWKLVNCLRCFKVDSCSEWSVGLEEPFPILGFVILGRTALGRAWIEKQHIFVLNQRPLGLAVALRTTCYAKHMLAQTPSLVVKSKIGSLTYDKRTKKKRARGKTMIVHFVKKGGDCAWCLKMLGLITIGCMQSFIKSAPHLYISMNDGYRLELLITT